MNAVMAKKALLVEISKKKNKGSNDSDSEEFYESFWSEACMKQYLTGEAHKEKINLSLNNNSELFLLNH